MTTIRNQTEASGHVLLSAENTDGSAPVPSESVSMAPVAVVIPCYRCSDTIERAVVSVARQSQRPAELFLVDDASGDSTAGALTDLRERYGADWIHIVTLPMNGGAGNARNVGWEMSKSPFVAFLDADDSWALTKVEVQYGWMSSHPYATLTWHGRSQDGSLDGAQAPAEPVWQEVSSGTLLWRNLAPTSAVMVRRDVPLRFPPDMRYSEDFWLWLQLVHGGGRAFALDTLLAASYKPSFGAHGLSAQLWRMERGELRTYRDLRVEGRISWAKQGVLTVWSIAKYGRRVLISRRQG